MKVLITGGNGFIGKNLHLHLSERKDIKTLSFLRGDAVDKLHALVESTDFIFHLAGINRSDNQLEFNNVNLGLTKELYKAVATVALKTGKKIPIIFTSSIQASQNNTYGQSKYEAEKTLNELHHKLQIPLYIFRLPNIFGKGAKPNYNSVVATFCFNIANDLPITVNDPNTPLNLVYIDDLIKRFLQIIDGVNLNRNCEGLIDINPQYSITVGNLAELIKSFKNSRTTLMINRVGSGFERALYATYLSYLPTRLFTYNLPQHIDQRGAFIEILKTPDCGQFSYFTMHPGSIRGGHYHHTKVEKFLVIKGIAHFQFMNMNTGEKFEVTTSGDLPIIIETIPGWTHNITNIGNQELIALIWANEIFDRENPDTYSCAL